MTTLEARAPRSARTRRRHNSTSRRPFQPQAAPRAAPGSALTLPPRVAQAEGYTFVLTGGDGSRTLGFCRRFLPPGAGPRYPQVLCLLSAHPWFSLFSNVLKALEPYAFPLAESATLASGSPVAAVLRALAGAPLPPPGGLLPPGGGSGAPASARRTAATGDPDASVCDSASGKAYGSNALSTLLNSENQGCADSRHSTCG